MDRRRAYLRVCPRYMQVRCLDKGPLLADDMDLAQLRLATVWPVHGRMSEIGPYGGGEGREVHPGNMEAIMENRADLPGG